MAIQRPKQVHSKLCSLEEDNMATIYKFKAYYKKNGVGATQSPAPVCTVINMADDSKVADAQATVASTNMPGLYGPLSRTGWKKA